MRLLCVHLRAGMTGQFLAQFLGHARICHRRDENHA